jgi:hypothetical protein
VSVRHWPTPTLSHPCPRLFAKQDQQTRDLTIQKLYAIPDKELDFFLPQLW